MLNALIFSDIYLFVGVIDSPKNAGCLSRCYHFAITLSSSCSLPISIAVFVVISGAKIIIYFELCKLHNVICII